MIEQDKAKKYFANDNRKIRHHITEMKTPSTIAQGQDITKCKQLEKEIGLYERLSLIGEMATCIGHEIRNPLTSVRGFLQFLGDKNECVQYKEYFDLMICELDRANSIITEFLLLAKDRPLVLKTQNLKPIIEALMSLIIAEATDVNMYVHIELEDIPDLLLNEKEIKQLILNLVRNGLEAMKPEGTLTVRAFIEDENIILSVNDQGNGIKSEVIEKIGTPFFSTKDHRTGLGLAVCYSIAARHKASIDIETSSNGTTFNVIFKK